MQSLTPVKWTTLPNAVAIHNLIQSLKAEPEKWLKVNKSLYSPTRESEWSQAWATAAKIALARGGDYTPAWNQFWREARDEANSIAWNPSWTLAWGVYCALIAWDDSVDLLDMTPDQVGYMAAAGNPLAILMHGAVCVAHADKNVPILETVEA